MLPGFFYVGQLEVIDGKLELISQANVAVSGDPPVLRIACPHDVVNRIYVLQEGGDALQPIGQFSGNRVEIDSAALLKIRELRDLESIEHHLPANPPGAESGRFPIVFFELDVMLA